MQQYIIKGQQLVLHPGRVVFWEEQSALILSDLHFGKTGHFRKSGIAIPQNVYKEDLQRLVSLIQLFKPKQLIIVGDLFHSESNKELDLFKKWRSDLSFLQIQLIKGNHDILPGSWYEEADINVCNEKLIVSDFCFCHDLAVINTNAANTGLFYFSGHIHPGISIKGLGKQSLRFPCFYFTSHFAVLPAFSRFTGTHGIDPARQDDVFAIVEDTILKVN